MSTLDFIKKNKHSDELLPKLISAKEPVKEEEIYAKLIDMLKKTHTQEDIDLVQKAYLLAKSAHGDQKRKSGEPYIIHPIQVAIILTEMDMDRDTMCAGILNEDVEDRDITA